MFIVWLFAVSAGLDTTTTVIIVVCVVVGLIVVALVVVGIIIAAICISKKQKMERKLSHCFCVLL